MSRSVRTDFELLKTPHHVYKREGVIKISYMGVTVPLTDEQLYWLRADTEPEFERKAEEYNVSPTNEDWAKYHRAKAGLLALQAYDDAHGLGDIEILMPAPRTEYKFTETHDEWIERCHQLVQAERKAA